MPDMERPSVAAGTSEAAPGTAAPGSGARPDPGPAPLDTSAVPDTVSEAGARDAGSAHADPFGGAPSEGPGQVAADGPSQAWDALGGDPELLERVVSVRRPGLLPARLPVMELARASVTVCSLAAAELAAQRAGTPADVPEVTVDDGAVATAFAGERHLRRDGGPASSFAPLSRFWRTADGWLRTHANYPHHRARLLDALGLAGTGGGVGSANASDEEALVERVAAALAEREAAETEATVHAAGGLAVAVRTPGTWARHPQAVHVGRRPLLSSARLDQAPPSGLAGSTLEAGRGRGALHGARVLDLTRVIAGPVATRTLALLGADVLRLDSPQLPESVDAHAHTGFGKRSALLDLSSRSGQATFEELLSAADIVLTGYRPGALDRYGLAPESLADRRPGLVVGQLSAWGQYGPWHRRRGFDSIVQAATGIAVVESVRAGAGPDAQGTEAGEPGEGPAYVSGLAEGVAPGALPAQALDHGSGYLLAAGVLRALTEQRRGSGGSRLVRVALARTAWWLLHGLAPAPAPAHASGDGAPGSSWLAETDSPLGRLTYALPPVGYAGCPADWSQAPGVPGADSPAWW